MTNIDVRLQYQKDTGLGLQTINDTASHDREDVELYLEWLEEKVIVLTQGIQAWEAANAIATAAQKAVHGKSNK